MGLWDPDSVRKFTGVGWELKWDPLVLCMNSHKFSFMPKLCSVWNTHKSTTTRTLRLEQQSTQVEVPDWLLEQVGLKQQSQGYENRINTEDNSESKSELMVSRLSLAQRALLLVVLGQCSNEGEIESRRLYPVKPVSKEVAWDTSTSHSHPGQGWLELVGDTGTGWRDTPECL